MALDGHEIHDAPAGERWPVVPPEDQVLSDVEVEDQTRALAITRDESDAGVDDRPR